MRKQRRSPPPFVRRVRALAQAATLATLLTPLAAPVAHAAGFVGVPTTPVTQNPAAPQLKVDIVPLGAPMGPWRLRVENAGPVPVRLIADARLVTLDVEATAQEEDDAQTAAAATGPRKAVALDKKSAKRKKGPLVAHCRLPAEMQPVDQDDGRALVVPPGRAYAETFDVRAMCFGAALDTLVPGAKVTPHYGWTAKPKKITRRAQEPRAFSGPAVAGPVDFTSPALTSGAPPVEAIASLDAPALTLAAPPVLDPNVARPPQPDEDRDGDGVPDNPGALDRHHHLVLSLPRYVDHESRLDIPAPLTLTNEGDRPRAVFYRASRVRYDVISPVGEHVTCGSPPDQTPLREFYTHLGHGQSSHISMVVSAVCDVDTFARAGVYEVVAHLDESGLAGAQDTLGAFAGVLSSRPMLVRVRRESRHSEAPRPQLQ